MRKLFKGFVEEVADEEMCKALTILHEQFPDIGGFQSPSVGLVTYSVIRSFEDTVYIAYDSDRNHWVTVIIPKILRGNGNVRTVYVYDSLLRVIGVSNLTTSLSCQIASMCQEKGPTIRVVFPPCQQQTDKKSCGYFAVANALSYCLTRKIKCTFFKISELQNHFRVCLERGKFSPFPKDPSVFRSPQKVSRKEDISVLCVCRMPQEFDVKTVECENCLEWYHLKCVGLQSSPGEWICKSCAPE